MYEVQVVVGAFIFYIDFVHNYFSDGNLRVFLQMIYELVPVDEAFAFGEIIESDFNFVFQKIIFTFVGVLG